ncbi:MAG TPA: TolC family protein [Longimicrobiales bacterium]|nr:TolC family protein [Longimicrobiales bacterium]
MARKHWTGVWIGVAAAALAGGATAQEAVTLTLAEALELARQNNPAFLSTRNDEGVAAWSLREAYGNFLPRASVNAGVDYQEPGAARIGTFTAEELGFARSPSYYFSDYSASVSLSLSGQTFFNVAQQRANRHAAAAGVRAAEVMLESAVTQSYIAVLRARDLVEVRRQQLERAEENLTLAAARAAAGVAIPLDAKQAQVERGRAQVNLLTAESDHETARLRLIQMIGLELDWDVRLTTEFTVFEPAWSRQSLVELATSTHPTLRSLGATASAQRSAARTAWSAYLPSLTALARLSGFTRQVGSDAYLIEQGKGALENRFESCQDFNDLNARLADPYPPQDCSRFALTDARLDSIQGAVLLNNRAFPFDFEKQPMTFSVGVSLPVFQGFSRQRQIEQAEAAAEDTELLLRGERLRLRTDVGAAHRRLTTAYQAVRIEETNRVLAEEQLGMARERYRVGLDSFIQLTDAETLKSEADQAYLAAVYTFHEALADLESAVGQALRPESR